MADKKMDAMEELKGLKYRDEAMVYLYYEQDTPLEFLANATGLAYSTVKNYVKYKFKHLLERAKKLFRKAKNIVRNSLPNGFYCYIDKITLCNGDVWCKIGQSTRDPEKRAQEIRSKGWRNGAIVPKSVKVMKIIKCKDETSMTNMEDCLRLGMTAINPSYFEKNDRLLDWGDDYPQRIMSNPFVKMGLEQFAVAA